MEAKQKENNRLIEFREAALGYGKRVVVDNVNLIIERGDFLGIAGPNGSGKTTLLKVLLKMIKPIKGSVYFGEELRLMKKPLGYVPQREFLDEIFPLTVMDVVMMGRYAPIGLVRKPTQEDYAIVHDAIAQVNMEGHVHRNFRDLSGGQKQRVLLARALASKPSMLVLDEPCDNLDIAGEQEIMELLKNLHDEHNLTVIMVSHLLTVMTNYVVKLAIIENGKLYVGKVDEVLTEENLQRIYNMKVKIYDVGGKKAIIGQP
ncbi:MAG TPA: metal ABC transporter ATP-binding protein [Candidatus Hypogeohydataceae bacterium YC41]